MNMQDWQVPKYQVYLLREKNAKYCLCIPVINEGERIIKQLERLEPYVDLVDVIICDGGSNDGSVDLEKLRQYKVNTLLVKIGLGKLSAQLRMGYAYALQQGYEGIITVDGNGKDGVDAIPSFIEALDEGWDMIQGSRYLPGGKAINTPWIRNLSVKLLHIPIISYAAGFRYTDTTNGFRGYSKKFLTDTQVAPFRNIFDTYELLAYLSVRAPQLGYRTKELPVTRSYPNKGKVPTKISFFKGNGKLLAILWNVLMKRYNPYKQQV